MGSPLYLFSLFSFSWASFQEELLLIKRCLFILYFRIKPEEKNVCFFLKGETIISRN